MRKINYPSDIRSFKKNYLKAIPDLTNKAQDWMTLWSGNPILQSLFPKRIERILLADYKKLIIYYLHYLKIVKSSLSADDFEILDNQLKNIFNYTDAQSQLAAFFMKYADDLQLSVCHYCESAYINAYSSSDSWILNRINNLSKLKLMKWLKISDRNAEKVIRFRNFTTASSFNEFWKKHIRKNNEDKFSSLRYEGNHFDLDHVLDKGQCPIVALSVMNFVPSCQVCNEKLKKSQVLGDRINIIPWEKLSPTSPLFDFDSMVEIKLKSISLISLDHAFALANRDYYELIFTAADSDYNEYIEVFRLDQRYQFHKAEGLYWLQTKRRYSDATISLMVNSLGTGNYSFSRLKEDIYRLEYDRFRKPCFDKMKRDILK